MSVAAAIGWGLALILFAASFWIRRQLRVRSRFTTRASKPVRVEARAVMPNASEALIYVENDGSARELTAADKKYVDTEFSPFDGARPYIKSHYEQRNAWGELRGYLLRDQVPDGVFIKPAPPESPAQQTPQVAVDSVLELVRKHRPDGEQKIRFKLPPN